MTDHNHMTRDIKALGKCPACDEHHERTAIRSLPALVDAAYDLLEELALPPAAQSPSEILRKRGELLQALVPVSNRRTSVMVGQ